MYATDERTYRVFRLEEDIEMLIAIKEWLEQ